MILPTEPIGSIPRPQYLLDGLAGNLGQAELDELRDRAVRETINRFEELGSPVVTDGEQGKPSFATYPIAGLSTLDPDGAVIPFADGHTRQLPRRCLDAGASSVQLDFTEGRLSLKLDPSGGLLGAFVELNNQVLDRFTDEERQRIGVHTCPGGDQDSVHSLDVDYAELLPALFNLNAGHFYLQLASEPDRRRVLKIVSEHSRADQRIFVGVTDPIDPRVETAEEVRDRVLEAAEYISPARLGTCDDCGFAPFADDTSTSRDTAFAKVAARIEGTRLAGEALGG